MLYKLKTLILVNNLLSNLIMFFKSIAWFPKITESEKSKKILSYDNRSEKVDKLDQKIYSIKIEFDEKLRKQLLIKSNDIFGKFSNNESIYFKLSQLKTRKRCYHTLLDEMRNGLDSKSYKREKAKLSDFISIEINKYKESISDIEAIKETIVSSISRKEVSNHFSEDDNYTKISSILIHWDKWEVKSAKIIGHFFKNKPPLVEFEINNYAKDKSTTNLSGEIPETIKVHIPIEKLLNNTKYTTILSEAYKNSSSKDKGIVNNYFNGKWKYKVFMETI